MFNKGTNCCCIMQSLSSVLVAECIICACELSFDSTLEVNELIECIDCGTELEVVSLNPLQLIEAPTEEEDWGE